MGYIFRRENGFCPKCEAFGRAYYIQDRYIGEGQYEYALMSKPLKQNTVQKFANTKDMVSSLAGMQITDDIAVNLLLSQMMEYQCNQYVLLNCGEDQYVWDRKEKELREHIKPKQETGFFGTYRECLTEAKRILIKKEQETIFATDEAV